MLTFLFQFFLMLPFRKYYYFKSPLSLLIARHLFSFAFSSKRGLCELAGENPLPPFPESVFPAIFFGLLVMQLFSSNWLFPLFFVYFSFTQFRNSLDYFSMIWKYYLNSWARRKKEERERGRKKEKKGGRFFVININSLRAGAEIFIIRKEKMEFFFLSLEE